MPTIHIRLTNEQLAALDAAAAGEARTRSQMAQLILAEKLSGEVAQMAKAPASNTGVRPQRRIGGSSPSLSAQAKPATEVCTSPTPPDQRQGVHVADSPVRRLQPTDLCEHGVEYRHCRMGMCKAALNPIEINEP